MRKMVNESSGQEISVHGYAMTTNGWEYFFLDPTVDKHGNRFALVHGFEEEMGDVHIDEIKPYLVVTADATDLTDLLPAEGWRWVD